jgi:Xaa-Pro aminopeptidase
VILLKEVKQLTPVEKLRTLLANENADGIFVKGDASLRYLTGFTGGDSLLYIDKEQKIIITDSRYTLQVKQQAPDCTLVEHTNGFWQAVAQLRVGKNLALDGDYFSYADQCSLAEVLPEATWQSLSLAGLRQVKTQQELNEITKAVDIADEAFRQLIPHIKAGVTEAALAAELEYNMRRLGSEKTSFTTIVASGIRSALPHGVASDKLVETGDFITFDFGATYHGYCSDITRTVVVGKAAAWQKEIYNIVLQAHLLGEAILKPGLTGQEVDAKVRQYIADKGYGQYFGHGLGHGVGLEIHEMPVLNTRNNIPLPMGAVVTIEPGIYLPGKGGVRIEDTVLLTADGARKLTASPKELREL